MWGPDLSLLQEQYMVLTTYPSLQPREPLKYMIYVRRRPEDKASGRLYICHPPFYSFVCLLNFYFILCVWVSSLSYAIENPGKRVSYLSNWGSVVSA